MVEPGGNQLPSNIPIPDPSLLTTQQLEREIAALRELLRSEIHTHALLDEVEFRRVAEQIDALDKLKSEKFNRVEQRFSMLESQRLEQKADNLDRIGIAMIAQKEAIDKSEKTTSESIRALGGKVDDLKDRIGLSEKLIGEGAANRTGGRETVYGIYLFAGLILTLITIAGLIVALRG
jgi:hypothetical protein